MRRSPIKPGKPLQRRTPLRATAPAKAEVQIHRMRKCPVKKGGCGASFRPLRAGQVACGPECAGPVGAWLKASKAKAAHIEDVKQTRAKLEALKTVPKLKREAQTAFNKFIRLRDQLAGHACISSGRPLDWGTAGITGSRVDAGHYRSTGAADHLRFNEDNCHAQSVSENRDKAGNAVSYRIGLIARIGLARVEALESNNTPIKWTREGLREIRDTYRRKARELERQQ